MLGILLSMDFSYFLCHSFFIFFYIEFKLVPSDANDVCSYFSQILFYVWKIPFLGIDVF